MARSRKHDRLRKVPLRLAAGLFLSVFPILLLVLSVTDSSAENAPPASSKHVLLFYSDNVRLPFSQQRSREVAFQEKVRSEAAPLAAEVSLEFWSGLPPENLKAKLSELPSHTAVLLGSENRDADGHSFVPRDLLGQITPFSWQLPAGSAVLFREQDVWQKYRRYFILGILALVIQSFLVVALTIEGQRRKKLSLELKDLSRRLIDAQEGERRRIARELHDDLNQRVVLLGSHIDGLNSSSNGPPKSVRITELAHEARAISSGISHLSHQLHSSALEILGLEPALRGLARDFSLAYDLEVSFSCAGETGPLPPDVKLCLFRVAQESLSNAVKHSGATVIDVHLAVPENGKTIRLSIRDNGKGFNPNKLQTDSLGIISMRERLRLVDGELSLNSSPGQGTDVIAQVKLGASSSLAAHA